MNCRQREAARCALGSSARAAHTGELVSFSRVFKHWPVCASHIRLRSIRSFSYSAHARTLTHPHFPSRPSRPLDPSPPSIRPPNAQAGLSKRPHAAHPTISRSRRTSHWQGNRLLAKRLRIVQALYGPRAGGAAHTLPAGRSTSTSMVPPRLLQVRRWARGSDAGVSVCHPTPSKRTAHPAISISR